MKTTGTLQETPAETGLNWRADRVLWIILGLAAFWGLVYNFVILRGLGPDELRHMNYVKLLLDEHRLPFLTAGDNEYARAHAYHPPLYYLLMVPVYALGRLVSEPFAVHLMRFASLLICLAALPLVYQMAWLAGERDVRVARLAAGIFASLPIFGMFMGVVNNDSATLLTSVLFVWLLTVKYPHETSIKSAVVIGLVFAAGALSKGSALLCNGAALAAYFVMQNSWRGLLRPQVLLRFAAAVFVLVLLAGPWYYRNHVLYGEWQPIPHGYTTAALPKPETGILVMMMHDNFPHVLVYSLWGIFYSLWAQKDWIPEAIRSGVYIALAALCLLAMAGSAVAHFRDKPAGAPPLEECMARVCNYVAFFFVWFSCLFIALFVHFGQAEGGRYLIPAFTGVAIFLARGWRALLGSARLGIVLAVWTSAFFGLNAICVYWLVTYLNPLHGPGGG